jgi:hypothetical protein
VQFWTAGDGGNVLTRKQIGKGFRQPGKWIGGESWRERIPGEPGFGSPGISSQKSEKSVNPDSITGLLRQKFDYVFLLTTLGSFSQELVKWRRHN